MLPIFILLALASVVFAQDSSSTGVNGLDDPVVKWYEKDVAFGKNPQDIALWCLSGLVISYIVYRIVYRFCCQGRAQRKAQLETAIYDQNAILSGQVQLTIPAATTLATSAVALPGNSSAAANGDGSSTGVMAADVRIPIQTSLIGDTLQSGASLAAAGATSLRSTLASGAQTAAQTASAATTAASGAASSALGGLRSVTNAARASLASAIAPVPLNPGHKRAESSAV